MSAEPTKTDVEEAIGRLNAALEARDVIDASVPDTWKVDDEEGAPHIMVPLAEFRTLLEAYAKRDAEVKEAVKLMKPFARDGHAMRSVPSPAEERALSTYVTKHEAEDVR